MNQEDKIFIGVMIFIVIEASILGYIFIPESKTINKYPYNNIEYENGLKDGYKYGYEKALHNMIFPYMNNTTIYYKDWPHNTSWIMVHYNDNNFSECFDKLGNYNYNLNCTIVEK